MLALILLTKGQSTRNMPIRADAPTSNTTNVQLRSTSRERSLQAEDLVSSAACLIVVPDALVEHWAEQIDSHVVHQGLKSYVDRTENLSSILPSSKKLARYDVVIVSFSRMAKEWKLHRPPSPLETRRTQKYGFEDQPDRYIDGSICGEISSSVHWLRVVVDEGHKLGGRAPTQLMQMSRLLCAQRRWVMTGTPSPSTLQSADLQYIYGLLVFLRNQPYGRPDGYVWSKAIARPFERNEVVAFYRLQHLLCRIMIRYTKESIRDILPRPIRHTVIVNPTPSEFTLYNATTEHVRANLVVTAIDVPANSDNQRRGTSCSVHPNSLLHRKNRKEAGYMENSLEFAFMGGHAVEWNVKKTKKNKTIEKVRESGVNESRVSTVDEYLSGVKLKKTTKCRECGFDRHFLMVLPCGHLCCAHCIEDLKKELGECCCNFCDEPYDEDEFDCLQPTFTGEIMPQGREKTITKLRVSGVPKSRIEHVTTYMDSRKSKPATECRSCHRPVHLLLIFPCGHLCCVDCAEKRFQEAGPICSLCYEPYSRIGFKTLQPDIHPQAIDDKDQRRKKVPVNSKKRKRAAPAKKTTRLVNLKRDFWRVESSKIFYMATRIRELLKEFSRPSLKRPRDLKAIIFSQFRESIWRTKVAFAQQGIPTSDFISLINPRERIQNLEEFRSNPDVNVLLLSSLGSHGLDLSFATHIFLLEEIWDKSVEMQVISRAHRMGASASVVVEQMWMKGTVECQLTSMNKQLFKSERASEDREDVQLQPTLEEVKEASSADKNSFQRMKMNYILNNLRRLQDDVAGEDGQVRFSVLDGNETIIRQGVHRISASGDVTTVSTMPDSPKKPADSATTTSPSESPQRSPVSTPRAARIVQRKPSSPEIIVIDDSSSDEEHKNDESEIALARAALRKAKDANAFVKQEPEYIEIKDEDTESE